MKFKDLLIGDKFKVVDSAGMNVPVLEKAESYRTATEPQIRNAFEVKACTKTWYCPDDMEVEKL